jgi:hypothetical protein
MRYRVLTICLLLMVGANCAFGLELGSVSGVIHESSGRPAVGFSVAIRSVGSVLPLERKTISDLKGRFEFMSLFPGAYTLDIFTTNPWNIVSKDLIIAPGKNDSLVIHLSDIVTMTFKSTRGNGEAADTIEDSKWVLRTSRSTRPILRLCEAPDSVTLVENTGLNNGAFPFPFRGILEISSSSDSSDSSRLGDPFNSSFALASVLSPHIRLLMAGGLGMSGANQTSIRSEINYKPNDRHSATLALGLRHFELPMWERPRPLQGPVSFAGGNTNPTPTQNLWISLDLQDRYKLSDGIEVMGGAAFDHIESVRSRNIVRPRMGLIATVLPDTTVRLLAMNTSTERSKTFDLPDGSSITLPSTARMTLSPDAARAESVNHFELSVERKLDDETRLIVSFYQDQYKDRSLFLTNMDAVNVGSSVERGYSLTVQARPASKIGLALGYAYAGSLEEVSLAREGPQALRTRYFHVLTGSVGYRLPKTQTQIDTVYRRILGTPVTLVDSFQTSYYAPEAGFNLLITQPLPNFTALPGQLEAQADFRNLFGESICPPNSALPVAFFSQQAREIRGGLSIKF